MNLNTGEAAGLRGRNGGLCTGVGMHSSAKSKSEGSWRQEQRILSLTESRLSLILKTRTLCQSWESPESLTKA